ncbi:hypothetical protein [Phaeobacter piscinae]|uniref:hypothetical protein n=1 Tax=Phaeobacter piscinae TaxID=1580596 RepID=UPI00058C4464|nr:hypothetical protein [Phaeobacter piscinae]UTS82723.1 hypothetical protein OL67_003833 [Phaeobacter piscinae]
MTPQKRIAELDKLGTAYVLARLDVQHGQNLMAFIEYEVLSHSPEWVELKPHCMKVKTGPRNGTIFSKEDLEKQGACGPVWHRWAEIGPLEIRT